MAKKQNKNDLEKLSFEQAIEILTEIVDKIETGQVPLAESLQQYEKGMSLIKQCRGILLNAEKRIEEIAGDEDEPDEALDKENDSDENNDESEGDDVLF
ncbi:MAG: exodeoxyribonuclease VII small subunit [Phycisphaerae bacterium]|nr:exodeoxyribonuclease VII small subunit [Phycisphaerae bacterium]